MWLSLAMHVAKSLGTPLPVACRRISNGRALRPEKLASEGPAVNSVRPERSLEAGFFMGLASCEDLDKPLRVFTPFRLVEALG